MIVRPYPICEHDDCTREAQGDRAGVLLCALHLPDRIFVPRFGEDVAFFSTIVVKTIVDHDHLRLFRHNQQCGTLIVPAGDGAQLCAALHMHEHGAADGGNNVVYDDPGIPF